jgi:hypothetical protein
MGDSTAAVDQAQRDETERLSLALVLTVLAWVAANDHDAVQAARLLGAVDAATRVIRKPSPDLEVPGELGIAGELALMTETKARARLTDGRFDAAFREGAAMTPAHAICIAVGEAQCGSGPRSTGLSALEQEAVAQSHVESILRQMGFESRAHAVAWVNGAATWSRGVSA